MSGGRVELGLGVGWLREEFDMLGVAWEHRGACNDEYIEAMRALWAAPHAEFHGRFVDFAPATCSPRPVQSSIPILVGGDTQAALRRAVRYADGCSPGEGDATRLKDLITRLRQAAEDHGRDPDEIEINAMFGVQIADPVAGVEQFTELGVAGPWCRRFPSSDPAASTGCRPSPRSSSRSRSPEAVAPKP